jgi:hypothetical protein
MFAERLTRLFVLALAMSGLCATSAYAVPAFSVQTGQPCSGCHIGGFGPQLTPFGRDFKMRGYTMRAGSFNVPLSIAAQASYVRTMKDQMSPPAAGFGVNDNWAVDQVNFFFAGGFGSHLGAFVQATYDGVAKAWNWDSLDLRAVTTATVDKTPMVLGLSFNNAPTVQDAWNTLPAWGFPYTASALAPSPAAAPLIGSLAQNTVGLTAYAWINSEVYLEAGGYTSPSANFLIHMGIDPTSPGLIQGAAPYGRIAYQHNYGTQNFEVGAFAMAANLYPGDVMTNGTDHYDDVGLDGSYQLFAKNKDVFTLNSRFTYEQQRLDASQSLGLATNDHVDLKDFRVDGSYYWRDKIGLTVQAFDTWGSQDQLLYAGNRTFKPDSSGLLFQLDGTPFGDGNSPLGKRFNLRLGIQYTDYFTFDGSGANYDGLGSRASDNNTVRVFAWVAY